MQIHRRRFVEALALGGAAIAAGGVSSCAPMPAPSRPEGGTTAERSKCIRDTMAGYVARGEAPGVVTLVSRNGEVSVDAVGTTAVAGTDPMRRDTLFRISSMTKPVTAVAALIAIEDGKLGLDEPVSGLLPELAHRRVLRRVDGPLDDTVPAKREITVRDLLTFRMGFGMVMAPPDAYPIQKAVTSAELMTMGPPKPASPLPPDEWLARFGALPLIHQPGEQWMYNTGAQVLGILLARAAKMPLEAFFRERIFEPLGMKDTSFTVPPEQLGRLATSYLTDPKSHALLPYDGVRDSQWSQPPVFPDGAAGLVSTVDDFYAFGQMLINEGAQGNVKILSPESVRAMTTDQITPEQKAASNFVPGFWETRGWGFGLSVFTKPDDVSGVPGRYGWDGGLGTSWYSDPKANLVGILMTQAMWTSPSPPPIWHDFWKGAYTI